MKDEGIKLSEWLKKNDQAEAIITVRDVPVPPKAPYLMDNTEIFDINEDPEPDAEVNRAFMGRPNVPRLDVVSAIRRDIGTTGYSLHISDSSYTGYSIWDVYRFVYLHDRTDLMSYISEVFDCDDFAQVLQGNVNRVLRGVAFGTIWYYGSTGGRPWGHAVNIGYCHLQRRIYMVEPQNDRFYRFNKSAWRAGMIII